MVNGSQVYVNVTVTSGGPTECGSFEDSTAAQATKATAYCLILMMALVGNLLVVATVLRNRRLRTSVNYFIVNMALSDLLIPLFAMPTRIQAIFVSDNQRWFIDGVLGTIMCKVMPFTENASLAVSMLSLLAVAVDRFIAVTFPLKPPLLTKKRCHVIVVITWLIAAVFSSPLLYTRRLKIVDGHTACYGTWAPAFDPIQGPRIYFIFLSVCFLAIPNSLLVTLYSVVICSLQSRNALRHNCMEVRRRREKENRKVTMMLVAVVVLFILAWTPFQIYFVMWLFVYNTHSPCWLHKFLYFSDFLSFSYTALNPFIYYNFNENYRRGFRELLGCPWLSCFLPLKFKSISVSPRKATLPITSTELRTMNFTETA